MEPTKMKFDGLVIGGGIAGIQSAIDLADHGYRVLLVERQPSIGGIMIGLNKVFPTLDCSSCICTPRMAEAAHHENITLWTYTDVERVERNGGSFKVEVIKKPRFVIEEHCKGCKECERVCPVDVPHEFDYGLGARRAIYIPHANAFPQVAVLDVENCTYCGLCAKACPTDCIDYSQEEERCTVEVGAVILATGLRMTPLGAKEEYGGGRFANVISPLAMERMQSSNGPYGGVMRPSDGQLPKSIAYVQCAGSRDASLGVPYCSRVCCMYALKQAVLLKHLDHDVDVTIFHMDIRAFGKGYEQFYRKAVAEGVNVVKGKVAKITEDEEQHLHLRVEVIEEGCIQERTFDMVVLSLGVLPGWQGRGVVEAQQGKNGFFASVNPKISPTMSSEDGIFIAGNAAGPKDIPDAIVEAGAAAMEASTYLEKARGPTVGAESGV